MKFSTQGLAKAGMALVPPFSVDVQLDPDMNWVHESTLALEFVHVSRVLPGRRLSGVARIGEREVFAKVFYGSGARRYWQRERQGVRWMQAGQIKTPSLLGQGCTSDLQGYFLLFQSLSDAQPVAANQSPEFHGAVRRMAQLHDLNLLQTDAHLNNFVVSQDEIWVVDADGLRQGRRLPQQFLNLATLFAQRCPTCDEEIPDLWAFYARLRGEYVERMFDADRMIDLVRRQRRERVRRYLKKTQRSCTEFVHEKRFRYEWLCRRDHWPALQRVMLFAEQVVQEATPLKLGNSATVVRADIDGRSYVIKRYNLKNVWHRVRRWFKRRARIAWCNGHWLHFLEIPTARPIALLETKWGWFRNVCYLVMEDVGEHNLGQLLSTAPDRLNDVGPQVMQILRELNAAGIRHGDLKASNFICHGERVVLIDYDAVQYADQREDRARFLQNWQEQSDLLAQWQRYLEQAGL